MKGTASCLLQQEVCVWAVGVLKEEDCPGQVQRLELHIFSPRYVQNCGLLYIPLFFFFTPNYYYVKMGFATLEKS